MPVDEQMDSCCNEVFDAFPFQLAPLNQGAVQFWCSKGFYPWIIVLTVVSNEAQAHRVALGKKDEARYAQVVSWTKALSEEERWFTGAALSAADAGQHAMWARNTFGQKVDLMKWQTFISLLKERHDFGPKLVAFAFEAFAARQLTRLDQLHEVVREFEQRSSLTGSSLLSG